MKALTKAEERIMQILWQLEKAFTKDIINHFEDDKPSYTTVATVLTILEQKGFVTQKKVGNSKYYQPLISKVAYSEYVLNNVVGKYFDGSLSKLVSFFSTQKNIDINELDEIMRTIEEMKKSK